jgi:hypothetical protein
MRRRQAHGGCPLAGSRQAPASYITTCRWQTPSTHATFYWSHEMSMSGMKMLRMMVAKNRLVEGLLPLCVVVVVLLCSERQQCRLDATRAHGSKVQHGKKDDELGLAHCRSQRPNLTRRRRMQWRDDSRHYQKNQALTYFSFKIQQLMSTLIPATMPWWWKRKLEPLSYSCSLMNLSSEYRH